MVCEFGQGEVSCDNAKQVAPNTADQVATLAHSFNMTAGWYGNACGCVDGCCSDHCDTLECFAGDINATLALGFDSYVRLYRFSVTLG